MQGKLIKPLSFLAAALVAALCIMHSSKPTSANELALGTKAKTTTLVDVFVLPPIDLNFKGRDEIFSLRKQEINRHPELLIGNYEPHSEIFEHVEDRKPWWGLYGMHVYREGKRSIEGPSKESMYLLNPFRLVSAEPNNIGMCDEDKLTEQDIANPDFPYFWKSGSVRWDPKNNIARISYDVSGYNRQLARWHNKISGVQSVNGFSLIAYNARDFGLRYVYLDPEYSTNIADWPARQPVEIRQFLHCGGSCGYPGGCNNMSPHMPALDLNSITKLPARAYIRLWKNRPSDVHVTPDLAYVIDFI